MRVLMQRRSCPACGHDHMFSRPAGAPPAGAYGDYCPEAGRAATAGPWGPWETAAYSSQGAIALATLGRTAPARGTQV